MRNATKNKCPISFSFADEYLNAVISLCVEKRGEEKSIVTVDDSRSMMQYILPLNEILIDFYDKLKSISSGYASFDYEEYGYTPSDLTKVCYSCLVRIKSSSDFIDRF